MGDPRFKDRRRVTLLAGIAQKWQEPGFIGQSLYMQLPSSRDEDELFFQRVIKALFHSFHKTTIARDSCSLEERDRFFKRFEIYFYLPPSVRSLDGENIDGVVFFDQLAFQAVRAIETYHEENRHRHPALPAGIGIHTETEWRFGGEVLEAEGMLGDKEHPEDLAVCFSFWVRFVQPIEQTAKRFKGKRIELPPDAGMGIEDRHKTWFIDDDGVISEEVALPNQPERTHLRSYRLRPQEPPIFPPMPEREGYEDEPEEEPELDWEDR